MSEQPIVLSFRLWNRTPSLGRKVRLRRAGGSKGNVRRLDYGSVFELGGNTALPLKGSCTNPCITCLVLVWHAMLCV